MNGKKQGRWVLRYAEGDVHEGPYETASGTASGSCAMWTGASTDVDGKMHGQWKRTRPYLGGKRHGRWTFCKR